MIGLTQFDVFYQLMHELNTALPKKREDPDGISKETCRDPGYF